MATLFQVRFGHKYRYGEQGTYGTGYGYVGVVYGYVNMVLGIIIPLTISTTKRVDMCLVLSSDSWLI